MKTENENWQPIGLAILNVVSVLEEKQRRVFERSCAEDGITPQVIHKLGDADASASA